MLSEVERTEVRRFLGFGVRGVHPSPASGALEWRLGGLSDAEEGVMRRYLGTLAVLERAVPGVGEGLDTGSAAGWTRNPAELSERLRLLDEWRRRLAAFLGVPVGPGLRSSGATVALVV